MRRITLMKTPKKSCDLVFVAHGGASQNSYSFVQRQGHAYYQRPRIDAQEMRARITERCKNYDSSNHNV